MQPTKFITYFGLIINHLRHLIPILIRISHIGILYNEIRKANRHQRTCDPVNT